MAAPHLRPSGSWAQPSCILYGLGAALRSAPWALWGAVMKLSIATFSINTDMTEKLDAIAAAGFKGVEIFEADLLSFEGTPAEVRKRVADLGLEIITFQPFRDFEGMPPDSRERIFARAERKFDLMGELGCDLLLV